MVFADMKNDFVFRRIFATHPDILRGLLNDLLERTGEETIDEIEYLPSEQLPLVEGAKLSIMDVRCKDRTGAMFVVEMQLIHHPGFIQRVAYNASKAYVNQLDAGDWYTKLMDVVAISICDFVLWPDAKEGEPSRPRVPMLSRWYTTEHSGKTHKLLQVQYAFLELPKVPRKRPEAAGVELWAWLFANAPTLTEIPGDLSPGPYREALELANQSKFTREEMTAYEKMRDEIRQVIEIAAARWAEGKVEGFVEGHAEGHKAGVADALLTVLRGRGIPVPEAVRERILAQKDPARLQRWLERAVIASTVAEVLDEGERSG
jgi:predicted transposase/invertase (TIGR01784 family)